MMGIFNRNVRKGAKPASSDAASATDTSLASAGSSSLRSSGLLNANMSSGSVHNPSFSSPTSAPPKVLMPRTPDPSLDPAAYLKSLDSVRERCNIILEKAKKNELNHFVVDMSKFDDTTKFVVSIIKRDFAPNYSSIPSHGRWHHFNVGGKDRIAHLLQSWPTTVDPSERTRRLLDLFLVSVLIDAGAGKAWTYKSKENGKTYNRSEGLAVASLEMFKSGMFSSDSNQPFQVDGEGLRRTTVETMAKALQVSDRNPLPGSEGRAHLLIRLADALKNQEFFGVDGRPGNMLDYLISHPTTQATSVPVILLPTLWSVLVDGLAPIWPSSRTQVDSISLGDAWPLSTMSRALPTFPPPQPWETIVPFHKLTQWLCYSLMQPMTKLMHIQFAGTELLTGLPEYRNGGLFIDTGVLTLKPEETQRGIKKFRMEAEKELGRYMEVVPMFEASDDVVVEWRAVTVGFLDLLHARVNKTLGLRGDDELSMPQLLEAGSWKGGREVAEVSRPNTKEPPIVILSDGTVF